VETASDFDDVARDAQASCGEIKVDPSQEAASPIQGVTHAMMSTIAR
jgi:hypothetical protein